MNLGDTIIMDNGAYEGNQVADRDLFLLIEDLQPDVVVLPDQPGSLSGTIKKSLKFLKETEDLEIPLQPDYMMVLHAVPVLTEFINAYEIASAIDGITWIGFSRLTQAYGLSSNLAGPLRRVNFIKKLQDEQIWNSRKNHHCLGMLSGNLAELPLLADLGIDSIDSSAPVWRGLHGFAMADQWPDHTLLLDTNLEFAEENLQLAESNLKEVMAACHKSKLEIK